MTRGRRIVLAVAIAVHAGVLAAPWIATYDPTEQHREFAFAPPTRLHLVDASGRWHLAPFVCAIAAAPDAAFRYVEDCSTIYPLSAFVRRSARVGFLTRERLHLVGVDEPGHVFFLGTDEFGRDVLSRAIVGARVSLAAAFGALGMALVIGVLLGSLAGYGSRAADAIVSGAIELVLALPWLYMLLAVRAALPLAMSPAQAILAVMLLLGAIGWARPARLVRAVVATIRSADYVAAARTAGASRAYIVRRHLLPQLPIVLVPLALQLLPQFILAETTLSLFGLGVPEPAPTWGSLLASAQRPQVASGAWWLLVPAAGLIGVCVIYYSLARTLRSGPLVPRQ